MQIISFYHPAFPFITGCFHYGIEFTYSQQLDDVNRLICYVLLTNLPCTGVCIYVCCLLNKIQFNFFKE